MSDTSHIDRMRFQAACYESNAREAEYDAALERKRPFILVGARIFPDGDQWCALFGPNIQEGVCGFGATPAKASIAFDLAWLNQTLTPNEEV